MGATRYSPYIIEKRSPKGNTWSAIPFALLCMVVNQNERQGSGPVGDKRADSRPERTGFRPEKSNFRPKRADFRG